jgi:hypothetical protein
LFVGGEFDGGVFGGGFDGGGGGGGGGLLLAAVCCTLIFRAVWVESPLASETETLKLKVPDAVGVPETVPELLSRLTPWGS